MVEITELHDDEPIEVTTPESTMEGAPQLPPGMAEFTGKSSEEMLAELKKSPFFMDSYDANGDHGDNPQLEALKSLQSEGTPKEIAERQKSRGNDFYKRKQYREALKCYTEGIDARCGVKFIEAALYTNRAACNLEFKNYAMCIGDCRKCLDRQPKNVKALFRCSKAMFAIERYEDAEKTLLYAVSIDDENVAVNAMLKKVRARIQAIIKAEERKARAKAEKEQKDKALKEALSLRGIVNLRTNEPADTPDGSKLHLEDSKDVQSQLIIPAMVLYPTTDEFDFVSEVSELTTPLQLAEIVMDRPDSYFEDGKHTNFRPKRLEAYLETQSGGLIKVGKKVIFSKALMQAHAPLFDGILRVYLVPRIDSTNWISKWDKMKALGKRQQ
ncbi:hypothetical protein FOA43_003130 [Brettanomyces nanus]|uniref:Cns1/TTC4 wheel domain-containing protein n=1 Tax=Eeniella nana TaxID=13502 RepID=A0A875RQ23_EENNA|nr:uncharacterized protein FOA43_003130 [Brettanomyces nanus]QPG75770.1 hypothetical protein FOA43_003130 [Brettanomyces nanus]